MRSVRASSGPFDERPYYEDSEIEEIALEALRAVELLPKHSEPVRIDRFVEKRFGVVPRYDDLPPGILGFTRFGSGSVEEVVLSRSLSEDGGRVAERRLTSTLAHEAGHMLLHGYLFSLERRQPSLFLEDVDPTARRILCRTDAVGATTVGSARYDGRWWEYQANQMIGPLLIPRPALNEVLRPLLTHRGQMELRTLEDERRGEAVRRLATVFDVNPVVARIRLDKILACSDERQLTF